MIPTFAMNAPMIAGGPTMLQVVGFLVFLLGVGLILLPRPILIYVRRRRANRRRPTSPPSVGAAVTANNVATATIPLSTESQEQCSSVSATRRSRPRSKCRCRTVRRSRCVHYAPVTVTITGLPQTTTPATAVDVNTAAAASADSKPPVPPPQQGQGNCGKNARERRRERRRNRNRGAQPVQTGGAVAGAAGTGIGVGAHIPSDEDVRLIEEASVPLGATSSEPATIFDLVSSSDVEGIRTIVMDGLKVLADKHNVRPTELHQMVNQAATGSAAGPCGDGHDD